MCLYLKQNFVLNSRVTAEFWPENIIADANKLCNCLEILAVWHNQTNGEHLAAVRVQTQIVDEWTQLQVRFYLAQRHVITGL